MERIKTWCGNEVLVLFKPSSSLSGCSQKSVCLPGLIWAVIRLLALRNSCFGLIYPEEIYYRGLFKNNYLTNDINCYIWMAFVHVTFHVFSALLTSIRYYESWNVLFLSCSGIQKHKVFSPDDVFWLKCGAEEVDVPVASSPLALWCFQLAS